MKSKILLLCILICGLYFAPNAQVPTIAWQKTYGGNGNDSLIAIATTNDGGFIVSGFSNSNISTYKTKNSYGRSFDFWIVKLNANGKIQWDKTFGGLGADVNPTVIQTKDGGYLIGGKSMSNISGDKTDPAYNESHDYWIIKIDKDGNILWDNTIGNIQLDGVQALANISGKGSRYMIAGYTYSGYGNDKTDENRGSNLWSDYWIVKLNGRGKIEFDKTIGGKNEDFLASMKETKDSGYILGGYSYSPSGYEKTDSFKGNNDFWVVKTNASGNKVWDKVIGGSRSDYLTSLDQATDGGYIFGGYSNSPTSFDKSGILRGVTDYWVVKTDANGNKKWDRTAGGALGDYLTCVIQTADKGYLLGGYSNSNISNEKTENSKGGDDIWLVKLDSMGNKKWDKTIGGSGKDRLSMLKEISAGQYIIGATSNSPVSGDKADATIGGTGVNDYWILKLTTAGMVAAKATDVSEEQATALDASVMQSEKEDIMRLTLQASPNPTKGLINLKYSGGSDGHAISLAVYNHSGRTVTRAKLPAGSSSYSLDISGQAAGTYYIVIKSGNSSATHVIVKQ